MQVKNNLCKVAVIAGISLAVLTGCSNPPSAPVVNPESSSSPVSEIPETALPNNGKVKDNGHGEYLQTTILDDDPAMQLNENIIDDEVKEIYSDAKILKAQQTVIKFIAEETIDSRIQGGGNVNEWLTNNKTRFTEPYLLEARKAIEDPNGGFLINNPEREKAGYDLAYDPDDIRISYRIITPTSITLASGDRPLVEADIEYGIKTNDGKQEVASGTVSYAVTENQNGDWLISGYKNSVKISPVTVSLDAIKTP